MPLTGPSSWLPTLDQFLQHWTEVENHLGKPLVLSDRSTLGELQRRRNGLESSRKLLKKTGAAHELAVGLVDQLRLESNERLTTFNRKVRADLAKSPYATMLPLVPSKKAGRTDYEAAMEAAATLWEQINALPPSGFKPPLLLRDGYSKEQFDLLHAELREAFKNEAAMSQTATLQIETRDTLFDAIYPILVLYRKTISADFAPQSPFVMSLPPLRAPRGTTPDSVEASGDWDTATRRALFQWLPSDNANLDHYSIRVCLGPKYMGANEQVAGSALPCALGFSTLTGLGKAGAIATFKIYTVLKSGNEKGSRAIVIRRPA